MTRRNFILRLLALIAAITAFGAAAIEVIFYQVMAPPAADLIKMATVPLFDSALVTLFFMAAALFLSLPVIRFLGPTGDSDQDRPDQDRAAQVLKRLVNLPYYLGALAFLTFMAGSTIVAYRALEALGWPGETIIYGVLTGLICGSFALPMYVYYGRWVSEPAMEQILAGYPGLGPARSEGIRISVRRKFLAVTGLLVAAGAGYTALVGFGQTSAVLKNMEQMEQRLLEADPGAALLDQGSIVHASDPGIRSTDYFRSRLGSLSRFYLSLLAIALAVAGLLAGAAAREITRPIKTLGLAAEAVSRGQYDRPVVMVSNDELAHLAVSINAMMGTIQAQINDMAAMVERLRTGILQMDETSNTVLAIADEQAGGATEQASAVSETSSIAAEIVATARQISERARAVAGEAEQTLDACTQGEDKLRTARSRFDDVAGQVDEIGGAMERLEGRFQETYKIVEWISDIADQTELLALNAQLEAAGAGAEGKRFAVVAENTRRLAGRAADAAEEIRTLIAGIQEETKQAVWIAKDGRKLVDTGGEAIADAAQALGRISELARATAAAGREITLSTGQQTTATEQLADSVGEVAEVARRAEDGARNIHGAIARLRSFAESLSGLVEKPE